MAYKKDYQAEINDAVLKGDYAKASTLEQERNSKIDAENLSYEKTNNYIKPQGVSDSLYNEKMAKNTFNPSTNVQSWDSATGQAYGNVANLTNGKRNIVSGEVKSTINSQFVIPTAVREADVYLQNQLTKIQSGRTSYTDEVEAMMDKIMNRDKFSYDVDKDPLFQQALASAMNSGKQAMQDTIGQASALTGGYGSTYATTAGNQAYNSFIEDAYDNLPQYYQMAMEAYQMEGDEMYRQLGMYADADEREYGRYINAYDATYQHRNRMYDEAYAQFRDSKSDAFAMADLQLAEHNQKVSDAYTLYNVTSDQADKVYEREYNSWLDSINMLYKDMEMLNNDYWKKSDQELTISENQKDRDLTISENQKNREHTTSENQLQRDWQTSENQKDRDLTVSENAKNRAAKGSGGGGGGGGSLKSPSDTQMAKALEAYNNGGMAELNKYINSLPDSYNKDEIAQYIGAYGELPYSQRTYTVTDDGGWNVGWGIDNNAKVKDQYGNEFTLKQLAEYDEDIAKELSNKKYTKGTTYTKK